MNKKNQIFNFGRLNIQTKLIGSMIPLVLMVVAVLIFMRSAARQLEQAVRYSDEARLVEEVNSNFQLAVSKGKNVAILKDDKNKERTLKYMAATQGSIQKLLDLCETAEEKEMVEKIGDGANSVAEKLKTLVAVAKDTDKAEDLYSSLFEGHHHRF